MDVNGVEHHDAGTRSMNCRNRASSLVSSKNVDSRAETTSLLRGHVAASDNDDDDNDNDSAAHRPVPSTSLRATVDEELPQTSPSYLSASTAPSNDLRRRWTSLKQWFIPGSTPTPAIGLNDLQGQHIRLPVHTDVQGRLSCRSDAVVRLSSIADDEDQVPTIGCCFVRSRDAACLMSSSAGVAVCGPAAMYVSSVVSSDTISTARLLTDSSGPGTCSLTAARRDINTTCMQSHGRRRRQRGL